MHKIIVPPPVEIVNLLDDSPVIDEQTKKPMTIGLYGFLARFVFPDPKLGAGESGGEHVSRLRKLKDVQPGYTLLLDSDTVESVVRVIQNPSNQWVPQMVYQVRPLIAAFTEAEKA